jgi:hypothetical protein
MQFLAKLYGLNHRWLYLGFLIILIIPFIWEIPMEPDKIAPGTQGLYDLVESCPDDKVILIDSSWDAGSAAENRVQLDCVIRHIIGKKKKFVITSAQITVFAPEFADQVIKPIAEQAGYIYGKDWVNLGYKLAPAGAINVLIDSMCRNLHQVFPTDNRGTPVKDLPLMQNVKSIEDVHCVYCITYAPPNDWMSIVKGVFGKKVAFGCMKIMEPSYATFIDSGQLSGMVAGNGGAAEYEKLINQPATGTKLIIATSFGNCAVILAAVLGNLGFWAWKKTHKKAGE